MSPAKQPLLQKMVEKFSNSRDFTISLLLHLILVVVFGTSVLFQVPSEPSDFEGEPGRFVAGEPPALPPPSQQKAPETPNITLTPTTDTVRPIITISPSEMAPAITARIATPITPPALPDTRMVAPKPDTLRGDGLTESQASAIKNFTKDWVKSPGTGTRSQEFEFTAYIGQYAGGNWNSTIQQIGGKIENGSLPNLLDFMSSWSKNKVKTNYKNVKAVRLDSDELFVGDKDKGGPPPFIFLTGTRDFKLSDKEVENLQKYVRLGGAIWGDSSVPGRNSRFDTAFRREMKRVIPDVDKDWEVLPPNHPIYTQAYFPEVKDVPSGMNFYKEPICALKIYGEVAIIYTANDYGDMWQVGLDNRPGPTQGQVDLRRNEKGTPVAINEQIWNNRETYLRNITPESLITTYKFGANLVVHLLTRWENKTRTASSL